MKRHIALGLVASTLFLAGCCTTTHHVTKWEYKSVWNASDAKLSELGEQGWSVIAVETPAGASAPTYLLKRSKQ